MPNAAQIAHNKACREGRAGWQAAFAQELNARLPGRWVKAASIAPTGAPVRFITTLWNGIGEPAGKEGTGGTTMFHVGTTALRVYRHKFNARDFFQVRRASSKARLRYEAEDWAPLNTAESLLLEDACTAFGERCADSLLALGNATTLVAAGRASGTGARAARSPPASQPAQEDDESTPGGKHLRSVAAASISNKRLCTSTVKAVEELQAASGAPRPHPHPRARFACPPATTSTVCHAALRSMLRPVCHACSSLSRAGLCRWRQRCS